MREFTYIVPLEGTYRISNLPPKDTDEDFCMYEPVKMSFCTALEELNPNHPFQVSCKKDTGISSEEFMDIITGNLPWRLCAVDIDWQGLKLTILDNDMQIATCRLKFGCRIRICFTTTNDNRKVIHRYFL